MHDGQLGETEPGAQVPFEEFKLIYESAEKVTDRRLELNRSNVSLSILIIAGIGLIANWGIDKPKLYVVSCIIISTISTIAILFCIWWKNQIVAYKDLNGAKFSVLSEIAERVVFAGYMDGGVQSSKPFDREWDILQEKEELHEYKGRLALSATKSELIVPTSFQVFFSLCIFGSFVIVALRLLFGFSFS